MIDAFYKLYENRCCIPQPSHPNAFGIVCHALDRVLTALATRIRTSRFALRVRISHFRVAAHACAALWDFTARMKARLSLGSVPRGKSVMSQVSPGRISLALQGTSAWKGQRRPPLPVVTQGVCRIICEQVKIFVLSRAGLQWISYDRIQGDIGFFCR